MILFLLPIKESTSAKVINTCLIIIFFLQENKKGYHISVLCISNNNTI